MEHCKRRVRHTPGALLVGLLVFYSLAQSQAQPASTPHLTLRVTEQPGRPGVTEQRRSSDPEPGAENHHALPPGERARPIIVEALVNQYVAVPLLLDTGATYTILTKQTAQKLGITALERLPTRRFLTANGSVLYPVTTVQSVRVGTAEARAVEVAIDVEGHLPLGLLGMSFLRHFKVTMDHAQHQVTFERR